MARTILLTGATGYVGGRLLGRLIDGGNTVRCLVRDASRLRGRPGTEGAEIVEGNVLQADTLPAAMQDVHTVYYLVHSMGSAGGFEAADRLGAENIIAAARRAGVRRFIYLGGLGRQSEADSPHLRSRHEVGRLLRDSGIPTIELRASIIIGPGSLSFDLVRTLVERLPVLITPRWVRSLAQPIHIDDVLSYLQASLELPEGEQGVVDIGGPDQVGYSDLMKQYARQRGLRRLIIHVPLLSARLSSLWLGLVTPVYARVGRKLIDSLRHDTVVENDRALRLFPQIKPAGSSEAIHRALQDEDAQIAGTRWMDALSSSGEPVSDPTGQSRRRVDSRVMYVDATPAQVWQTVVSIGGQAGWYYADWLWQLRGALDLLVGGVGMRRGRRSAHQLLPGDTVDFWRVQRIEAEALLRLEAQMRLPGRAWLQFELAPEGSGTRLRQTAIYDPRGTLGLLYWWSVAPLHHLVFGGMLRGISRVARAQKTPIQSQVDTPA